MRVCQFRHFGSLQPGALHQLRELLVSQSLHPVSIRAGQTISALVRFREEFCAVFWLETASHVL